MTSPLYALSKPSQSQVTMSAEGIAAAQFARCGFDVSVQSGRDKPSYDLVVAKAGCLLKVLVKGSDDGSWALTQSYLKQVVDIHSQMANCQWAIDQWLAHHGSRTVCCLVQLQGVSIDQLPRIYLAFPEEIALKLRETAERLGSSNLYEQYEWKPAGEGSAEVENLPSMWGFSERRIHELLTRNFATGAKPMPRSKAPASTGIWTASVDLSRRNPATAVAGARI